MSTEHLKEGNEIPCQQEVVNKQTGLLGLSAIVRAAAKDLSYILVNKLSDGDFNDRCAILGIDPTRCNRIHLLISPYGVGFSSFKAEPLQTPPTPSSPTC